MKTLLNFLRTNLGKSIIINFESEVSSTEFVESLFYSSLGVIIVLILSIPFMVL